MNRRTAVRLLGAAAAASSAPAARFEPTWESLKQFRCPEWFRDAKLGIWAHWGPQGAPRQGDWYARNMYMQGSRQYEHHVKHYGHPSKFGFKDIIPLWRAEKWDPESLIRRYRQAGAKYFVALGAHCDNFDCWNSKHHRWNSVNFGPRKDVVGLWREAARKQGLRFGVTEHLAWSYTWFNTNKDSDKKGPLAGVPYDGNDPRYQDLYHEPHPGNAPGYPVNAPESWKQSWFKRVKDLVDQHQPDLVYTDGGAFGQAGLDLISHFYNANAGWHGGRMEGVYTLKDHRERAAKFNRYIGDFEPGAAVLDVERGVVDGIRDEPWQTDTCIGHWYYWDGFEYKTARQVIQILVDVVSKNGNLLLNFPLLPDGTLDAREDQVLAGLTDWMRVNAEAIHGTRPWKTHAEGPTSLGGGFMGEKSFQALTAADFRFTSKKNAVYAICMGWPETDVRIQALGAVEPRSVRLLGSMEKISWSRQDGALVIRKPARKPCEHAVTFRIES